MRSDRTATLPLASLAAAGATHPGRERETNEDRFYIDANDGIFLVVDGVGGEAAGEVAAEIAVRTIVERLTRHDGPVETRIREAITLANQQILHDAAEHPSRRGMACVLTVAVVDGRQLTVGHVGDSRLYKLTPEGIAKLTHDHSPVGEREDARELTETQAMQHARRNEVYRDVGSEPRQPDAASFIEVIFGDLPEDCAILLCSDGLSDMLTSLEINRLVRQHAADPAAAVDALVAAANAAGGRDNITVVLAAGRTFAQHNPPHPVVLPPAPPQGGAGAIVTPVLPVEAQTAPVDSRSEQPAAPTSAGPLRRLLRSRTLALMLGAALGAGAALTADYLEGPPRPRVLAVGGTTTEFRTITDALTAARAGDQVIVEPGEYAEQLVVPAGVTVLSRVPDAAVLVAAPGPGGWVALTVSGGGGGVRGFRISGSNRTISLGIRVLGDGVVIENSTFEGEIETAVEILDRAGASVLVANRFAVTGLPIRFAGSSGGAMLRRNLFVDGSAGRRGAIEIAGSGVPRLEDNTFVHLHPISPSRPDVSLQGNVVITPGARR